ncbi:MAG: DUF2461 domain-containing protein [Myxococcales bacterium]|nr:DUF2461 domain-containing protein [Myxococcales bacterium]MCB9706856.1 DUF2461 domain-containing protein [Myxococcales bacterium]
MSDAHFSPTTFEFLAELIDHNDKAWFEANKARYERVVRTPALAFIRALQPMMATISRHFVADDRKVGGSLMRIHRDVRFSADKTPYKTNIGVHIRHEVGKDVHAPGFYLHLSLDEGCFVGVGMWKPEASALKAVRERIVAAPAAWKKARDDAGFRACFEIVGDSLKRPPRGFDPEHAYIDDLRRTDHLASSKLAPKDLYGAAGPSRVGERFAAAKPYARFLTQALDLPF